MPIDLRRIVNCPEFSVKLTMNKIDGSRYYGTGFGVSIADENWLFTCRHNIEIEQRNFLGTNDLISLEILGESTILFDPIRRVVGIRIGGAIADCVAIELRPGEWRNKPRFDPSISMTMEGETLQEFLRFQSPHNESEFLQVPASGHVLFQGFSGSNVDSTTLRGAQAEALPTVIQPWMITYLPACEQGFSGGPVLKLEEGGASLLAITTHFFPATFRGAMEDGRIAEVETSASAGVPIKPLLQAMRQASAGNTIVDVPAP